MTKLSALPIPIPPVPEQDKLVLELEDALSLVDHLNRTLDFTLSRAGRLRQSILKSAFEGKLVPQDPNDEPASVLLERIRAARTQAAPSARVRYAKKRRATA